MPIFNVLLKYMVKKHIIYLKVQIFLFFSEVLSREIFVLLNKLCVFNHISIYIYIYVYIFSIYNFFT